MRVVTIAPVLAIVILASVLAVPRRAASEHAAEPAVAGFVPDISDEEWEAAVPAKGSDIALKQIKGPKRAAIPPGLRAGQQLHATVAVVVRRDGTQGVYKVIATNNPAFATELVRALRQQQFKPPTRQGVAIAVRGEISQELVVTK